MGVGKVSGEEGTGSTGCVSAPSEWPDCSAFGTPNDESRARVRFGTVRVRQAPNCTDPNRRLGQSVRDGGSGSPQYESCSGGFRAIVSWRGTLGDAVGFGSKVCVRGASSRTRVGDQGLLNKVGDREQGHSEFQPLNVPDRGVCTKAQLRQNLFASSEMMQLNPAAKNRSIRRCNIVP